MVVVEIPVFAVQVFDVGPEGDQPAAGLEGAQGVAERQVLTLGAADATGKVQSVNVTLDAENAASAEQAVALGVVDGIADDEASRLAELAA